MIEAHAADTPSYDQAVGAAATVATKGFDVLPGLHPVAQSIGMLGLGLVGLAVVIMIGLILRDRLGGGRKDEDPPAGPCPPSGCPEISGVLTELKALRERMDADVAAANEQRSRVEIHLTRVHERVDGLTEGFVTRPEIDQVMKLLQHIQEESGRAFAAIVGFVEGSSPPRPVSVKRKAPHS